MPEPTPAQFGTSDCTCIPWTRKDGPPRHCGPADTVDQISGWERRPDCPHHAPFAVWVDGEPLMEAIASAVYEKCTTCDSGLVLDDPRNIAAVAAAVVRRQPTPAPVPADVRDQIARALYEWGCQPHLWADAHPDDRLAYGADADAVLRVPAIAEALNAAAAVERVRAELEDVRHNLALRAFTAPDADFGTIYSSLDVRIRDARQERP